MIIRVRVSSALCFEDTRMCDKSWALSIVCVVCITSPSSLDATPCLSLYVGASVWGQAGERFSGPLSLTLGWSSIPADVVALHCWAERTLHSPNTNARHEGRIIAEIGRNTTGNADVFSVVPIFSTFFSFCGNFFPQPHIRQLVLLGTSLPSIFQFVTRLL